MGPIHPRSLLGFWVDFTMEDLNENQHRRLSGQFFSHQWQKGKKFTMSHLMTGMKRTTIYDVLQRQTRQAHGKKIWNWQNCLQIDQKEALKPCQVFTAQDWHVYPQVGPLIKNWPVKSCSDSQGRRCAVPPPGEIISGLGRPAGESQKVLQHIASPLFCAPKLSLIIKPISAWKITAALEIKATTSPVICLEGMYLRKLGSSPWRSSL